MTSPHWPRGGDPLATFRELGAVDTLCWTGSREGNRRCQASWPDLARHRERLGLSRLWVASLEALGGDRERANAAVLAEAPAWARPFVVLTPADIASVPRWVRDGAVGARLPLDGVTESTIEEWADLGRAAQRAGLLVHVIVRLDDARTRPPHAPWTDPAPEAVLTLCRALGDGPVVVSGLNIVELTFMADRVDTNAEVVFDLWFVNGPTGVLAELDRAGQGRRLAFATGHPLQSPAAKAVQCAVADLDPATRTAIVTGNAHRVLTSVAPQGSTPN